ncbi:MAG: hypothetical protein KGQ70_03810 [Alphaproteobacteria bacterium]|nr:hypothetical protein [Alphaproteobacteria bacterium]
MTFPPRPYTGRVIDVHDVAADTRRITVEIEGRQRLPFGAGQYMNLSVAGFEGRPFSIASAPHEALLEFHIKNSGHKNGKPGLSAHIAETLKPGHAITLEGPLGNIRWRPDGASRPLLMLAGGLGIAPLKSIITACLHGAGHPPVHLYWGVRTREQLYLDGFFRGLAKRTPRFSYIPVLSDEKDPAPCRGGLIGHAVAEDFETLAGFSVYMAGPPVMIDATLPLLLHKNAEEDYIFSD